MTDFLLVAWPVSADEIGVLAGVGLGRTAALCEMTLCFAGYNGTRNTEETCGAGCCQDRHVLARSTSIQRDDAKLRATKGYFEARARFTCRRYPPFSFARSCRITLSSLRRLDVQKQVCQRV